MLKVRTTVVAVATVAAMAAGTALAQTPQPAKPAAKPAPKVGAAQPAPAKPAAAAPKHVMVAPSDMKWGPGPDALPAGVQMAVLDGDPSKAGLPFVIRAKMPDGYRVPPHWHPTDESITVISGSLMLGMGDKFDEGSVTTLGAESYARMPKRMHHYAGTKGETVIQVHGIGPFAVTYINPGDDPRKKTQ